MALEGGTMDLVGLGDTGTLVQVHTDSVVMDTITQVVEKEATIEVIHSHSIYILQNIFLSNHLSLLFFLFITLRAQF